MKFKIKTLNNISAEGLGRFNRGSYDVGNDHEDPDAIIVRSYNMREYKLNKGLKVVGRAGAGVNNIPLERCAELGIPVLNTPGANANAVKEITIAGLFLASRDIYAGISFVDSIRDKGDKIAKIVEKEKKRFIGVEIKGKKIGILGLGAIGGQVANACVDLGMEVYGHDPFMSEEDIGRLNVNVRKVESLEGMLGMVDFLSVHVPLSDKTKNIIDISELKQMKKGVRILNFSRDGVINTQGIRNAIEDGIVSCYVTDFPNGSLVGTSNVICLPHVGASSREAEINCSTMISSQIIDFLENGNLINSVNFPNVSLPRTTNTRLTIANKNIPGMVGQISNILAGENINITGMVNKSRGEYAYNIFDLKSDYRCDLMSKIKNIDGIFSIRFI